MKIDVEIGRVIGETETFVDIELDGHDIRNLLSIHASDCFEKFSPEERAKISEVIVILTNGNISANHCNCRVRKNCYAFANSRPPENEK